MDELYFNSIIEIKKHNFKQINDSMGHHAGDILLQELASRFTSNNSSPSPSSSDTP